MFISYLVLYFVLIKGEMLKTEFECEYKGKLVFEVSTVIIQISAIF